MSSIYIFPELEIHSNFDAAKDFYADNELILPLRGAKQLTINDLTLSNRNLIVGEPGVGKTSLLHAIDTYLLEKSYKTIFISLKQTNSEELIDSFLQESLEPKALLLDALDEVKSKNLSNILSKIEDVSKICPDAQIYVSSRWAFITKYHASFPEFRFISVSPFNAQQVRMYLIGLGYPDRTISSLLEKMRSFSSSMNILQVPRYLKYLTKMIQEKGLDTFDDWGTRNKIFENFIYSALDEEDKKTHVEKSAITKRLLEKLALTMEIYQSNVISKDELMTFFDEIASDLKVVALAQFDVQSLFDRSILKVSNGFIEFDNREFQEYLAAKEISRLSDYNRSAFYFAVDQNIKEIYPSWFNTLSFLVDMQNEFLEQLVEYSGLRLQDYKIVDSEFLSFISSVSARQLSQETRRQLFKDVVAYHEKVLHWIPWGLPKALAGFYDPSLEHILKKSVDKVGALRTEKEIVILGNVDRVLMALLEAGLQVDRPYWRRRFIEHASVAAVNDVLQRSALAALEALNDPSVIDELPDLVSHQQLVTEAFLSLCASVAPNNPKSVGYFIDAIRRENYEGRHGLFQLNSTAAITQFLSAYNTDEKFRRLFLDQGQVFHNNEDGKIVANIGSVLGNSEVERLAKAAVQISINHQIYHGGNSSDFVFGLWRLLKSANNQFLVEMVRELDGGKANMPGVFFYAQQLFAEELNVEDVDAFLDVMIEVGQEISAFDVMHIVKFSGRDGSDAIYERGRSKLSDYYTRSESRVELVREDPRQRDLETLRTLLQPEPGKFDHSVFNFFNRHFDDLKDVLQLSDFDRLSSLITGTIFEYIDPGVADLKITEESNAGRRLTYSSNIPLFGGAIRSAKIIGLDITPYRKKIIDYIPFSDNECLKDIFTILTSITAEEFQSVIDVYLERRSDLWRHEPINFVNTVERFHLINALPALQSMVMEAKYDRYTRQRALAVLDALNPDAEYLRQIFSMYTESDTDDLKLANLANELLIISHADSASVLWRLKRVSARSIVSSETQEINIIDVDERELWSKHFAKPLMQLKRPGFESQFLELLDTSMELWAKGSQYHHNAQYLWDVVYAYFDNLKDEKSFRPLTMVEEKISHIKDKAGANWLAARLVDLRGAYLSALGKPRNISEAIKKYNESRAFHDKKISSAEDLFRQVQFALDIELRNWIEGEGAYQLIRGDKVYKSKRQAYEELIQKTLKTQVENILLRRGFQVELIREPQLYDNKRVDILLRHGFTGPIIIEIKLTSNADLKRKDLAATKSYFNMKQYMAGYGATHGIFLVVDNTSANNLPAIALRFQTISNVVVQTFTCADASKPRIGRKIKNR